MADSLQREFIKISQAVGVGFLIMGAAGVVGSFGEEGAGLGVLDAGERVSSPTFPRNRDPEVCRCGGQLCGGGSQDRGLQARLDERRDMARKPGVL